MTRALACSLLVALVACHDKPQVRVDPAAPKDAAAPRRPDSPAGDLVKRLIAHPPERMSDLEAVVGPIHMSFRNGDHDNVGFVERPSDPRGEFSALVPRLGLQYAWDRYHQDPTTPRDVAITHVWLEIRGDPRDADQVLRDHFGTPRTVVEKLEGTTQATSYSAFHPFYLTLDQGTAGTFQLSWYSDVPRFAIPEPDPARREAWLRAFAHRLATATSVDEIAAFCAAAPADAGIEVTGTLNDKVNPYGRPAKDGRDFWIELVPPVRATLLADVFDWGQMVGVSRDVHLASWHVERRDQGWLPLTGADRQWELEAILTQIPHDTSAAAGDPGEPAYLIGDGDEVSHVAVRPRFK